MRIALLLVFTALLAAPVAQAKIFKAYNGDIDFDHSKHMGMYPCKDCHEGPPRPFGLDKQKAHKLCIGCHTKEGAGPVRHCSQCHGNGDKAKD